MIGIRKQTEFYNRKAVELKTKELEMSIGLADNALFMFRSSCNRLFIALRKPIKLR